MRVSITIQGVSPLLMNRFTETSEVALSSGTRVTFQGSKGTPRQQAAPKAYRHDDGPLYLPGSNIFSCLIAAGRFTKSGRNRLTTLKSSLVPAGIGIEELICPLTDHDGAPIGNFEVDSRSVVNPSTGGRVMCHRPRVDDWRCRFTVEIDDAMFSPDLVRQVVDDAGKKIGIGDFRPERKGPFGRFVVVEWAVLEKDLSRVA